MTQVSKWFRSKGQLTHALSRIDLDIASGEFVSVIGPSGCGKSTLLRVAGGLLEPDGGTVMVEGGSAREARRAKRYGFVPQRPALLPWRTVRHNVALLNDVNRRAGGPGMDQRQQQAMLDHIGLGPFIDALPRELSGGMQQRVAIARAFALDAPVLLMDEPFSSLDEITRSTMRYLLLELWREARSTVLFVTHSIPEAVALSDRVVVLGSRPGRVTEIIDVDLPRPRHETIEDTDDFHHVVAEVRAALTEGWAT
jgi:NitT/TauT family transport system ATP-binding protein